MNAGEGWNESNWRPRFFTLWGGQALSLVGSALVQFAIIWWLTQETGSATVLATASMMGYLPQVVFFPFIGALVDRWNRRRVMLIADTCIALATLVLVFLYASGLVQIWHIYGLLLVRSVGGLFHWPAMQASTSLMVPREQLTRVAGLNQSLNGIVGIAAPPLGAVLLEWLPMQGILAIDVVTALLAVLPLLIIHIPQPVRSADDLQNSNIWKDLREGLRYVLSWQAMVILIVSAMFFKIALTPAFSLLPLLVKEHFSGDAVRFSAMEAAFGVGIILGGLLLGAWGGFKKRIYTMTLGLGLGGMCFLVVGLLPGNMFAVALGCLLVMGFMISFVDGPLMAVMQSTVAPELQGRVFTLMGSLVTVTSPIGLAIAGPVSDRVGVQVWYIIAGLMLMVTPLVLIVFPAIRDLEKGAYHKST